MMEVHSAIMLDTSGQRNHQPFLKKVGKFVSSICKTTKPKDRWEASNQTKGFYFFF